MTWPDDEDLGGSVMLYGMSPEPFDPVRPFDQRPLQLVIIPTQPGQPVSIPGSAALAQALQGRPSDAAMVAVLTALVKHDKARSPVDPLVRALARLLDHAAATGKPTLPPAF